MDLLGVQKDIDSLRLLLNAQQDRIASLEAQIAKDVNAIADKVIAAVLPEVKAARGSIDTITVMVNNSVEELNNSVRDTLALVKRGVIVQWGPEAQ